MKNLYKIIDLILLYSIGKRLAVTNGKTSRSVQNGRYIKTTNKTPHHIINCYHWSEGNYTIKL